MIFQFVNNITMKKIKVYLIHLFGGKTIEESKNEANNKYKIGYNIGYNDCTENKPFNDNCIFITDKDFIKQLKQLK